VQIGKHVTTYRKQMVLTYIDSPITKKDVLFSQNNRLKSDWKADQRQSKDIETNHNLTSNIGPLF
jgi:hypothetical protein